MGPSPPPGWRGEERALVAEFYQGSTTRTGSTAPLEYACVGNNAFHGWSVHAENTKTATFPTPLLTPDLFFTKLS